MKPIEPGEERAAHGPAQGTHGDLPTAPSGTNSCLKLATKCAPQTEALARAAASGFRHVELWTDAAVLTDWQRASEICRAQPLAYAIHFPNDPRIAHKLLESAARLYRSLDCRAMVIHQPVFDAVGELLLAIDGELCLAVENHRLSPKGLRAWTEANRYLTLDVEHLWKFTLDDAPLAQVFSALDEWLATAARKLRHVHLPGYVPGGREHSPMATNGEFVRGVWDRLSAARYEGFIVSEVSVRWQQAESLAGDVKLFETWREARERSGAE